MATLFFNTSYLNRTPNKTPRAAGGFRPIFVVWHETGGYGSLEWNLRRDVAASFNYLIKRDGSIWHYVNEREYVAWHAGKGDERAPWNGYSRWTINGKLYTGRSINENAIGVELEGPNNGEAITGLQRVAAIALMQWFNQTYGIPMTAAYNPEHAMVAPYYKFDALGFDINKILDAANTAEPTVAQRFEAAHKASGGVWRGEGMLSPGVRLGEPFKRGDIWHQRYERGVARLEGNAVIWLLLTEIAQLDV